jgi:hypothetical protein
MSEQRQVIEFLRRRYASAILRDDAPTAGRLRDQLDGLMNHARPKQAERTNAAVALLGQPILPGLGQPWMAPWHEAGGRLDSTPEVSDTT